MQMCLALMFILNVYVPGLEFDVTKLGFYKHNSISIFKTPDGYLLYSFADPLIVKVDEEGKVLYRFDKQGMGPGELQGNLPVGFDGTHFWTLKMGMRLQAFDVELKPTKSQSLQVPKPGMRAFLVDPKNILVQEPSMSADVGYVWPFQDPALPIKTLAIPKIRIPEMLIGGSKLFYHNGEVFSCISPSVEDFFEVDVFVWSDDQNLEQVVLSLSFSAEKDWNKHYQTFGNTSQVLRIGDLYCVQRRFADQTKEDWKTAFYIFNSEGKLLERFVRDGDDFGLIPVSNENAAFVCFYKGDSVWIKKITSLQKIGKETFKYTP